MTMMLARTDTSMVGKWWWTVDRWTIAALHGLIFIGAVLMLAASPAVATRIGLDSFYFVKHQLLMMPLAIGLMFSLSLLSPKTIRRLAVLGFLIGLALLPLTLSQPEIKGARRWVSFGPLTIQPSEFIKPCFAVVTAWMFAEQQKRQGFPGNILAGLLFAVTVGLLVAQPDLGMTVVVAAIWFAEFFLAGLPLIYAALCGATGVGGLVAAYYLFPHVASRIDRFIDPASGDSYQVEHGLQAFSNGGLWGRGPGEGTIKAMIPDAHADFIFSVAGEEFGLVTCALIVALFAFIVLRSAGRLLHDRNLFIVLAGTGLIVQFGLQALINMASTLHLMPTKGMTLPFISYGGSSLLALAIGMGMLLALTRRHYGELDL